MSTRGQSPPGSESLLPGISKVSRDEYERIRDLYYAQHPWYPDYIGMVNPYTGEVVQSRSDYERYLRERAWHTTSESYYRQWYDGKLSGEAQELRQIYDEREERLVSQYESRISALQAEADRSLFEAIRRHRLAAVARLLAFLVAILIPVFFVVRDQYQSDLTHAYNDGFAAAESVSSEIRSDSHDDVGESVDAPPHSSSSASSSTVSEPAVASSVIKKNTKTNSASHESYLQGYADAVDFSRSVSQQTGGFTAYDSVYADTIAQLDGERLESYKRGYADAVASFRAIAEQSGKRTTRIIVNRYDHKSSTSSYSSGKGSTASYSPSSPPSTTAPAVSTNVIGNKNTKKFHKPSCSYLPDKGNQIRFVSATAARSSGYVACAHCGG